MTLGGASNRQVGGTGDGVSGKEAPSSFKWSAVERLRQEYRHTRSWCHQSPSRAGFVVRKAIVSGEEVAIGGGARGVVPSIDTRSSPHSMGG